MITKVYIIHEVDDGIMTDEEIAEKVGCHSAYVRSVRDKAKRRSAVTARKGARR
jgi:DNA-binding IscR family transcriptional regulator